MSAGRRFLNVSVLSAFAALTLFAFFPSPAARAQESSSLRESDPAAALSAALNAACRAGEAEFANYLTADNAAAFRALPEEQRIALLKRFSLTEGAGKPLNSSDVQGRPVLRCQSSGQTVEYRFGDVRTRENLAFIPVSVANSEQTEFGLVRENGAWRLLSLGLVLLDIPQLSRQWELADREDAVIATLRKVVDAVDSYHRAFGKLPDSLAQLGPAPKDQISPDQAALLDAQLATGVANGYHFRYSVVPSETNSEPNFEIAATPDDYGKTGLRSFFLDGTGQIRAADKRGSAAVSTDPLIVGEKVPTP
jgi:hypothetical protein